MILFFNRLVQILSFYQKPLKRKLVDKFYFFIVTILFPIYSCAQIFFAIFDPLQNSNDWKAIADPVKGSVFFICFIGKLFLILFLYAFIKSRWLHAAILTLLSSEDLPFDLATNVKSISNSINSLQDDDDIGDLKVQLSNIEEKLKKIEETKSKTIEKTDKDN